MTDFVISESNKQYAKDKIDSLDCTNGKYVMNIRKFEELRSTLQNSFSHSWYNQLAKELKDYDALGWKCFCKLNYAVPLMRAEDAQFREFYDKSIKNTFTYEQKIKAMEYLPVTSLMSTKQLSRYLEIVKEAFANRVELLYPNDYYMDENYEHN